MPIRWPNPFARPTLPATEREQPNDAEREILDRIAAVVRESDQFIEDYVVSGISSSSDGGFYSRSYDGVYDGETLEELWTRNGRRFYGDQHDYLPQEGHRNFTANLIQPGLIAATAAVLQQSPTLTVQVEGRVGRPRYCLTYDAVETLRGLERLGHIQMALDPLTGEPVLQLSEQINLTREQLTGEATLSALERELLMQLGVVGSDALVTIDAEFAEDLANEIMTRQWRRMRGDIRLAQNEQNCRVFGHQPALIQWLDDEQRWEWRNPDLLNVRIDPNATDISDAHYATCDLVYPVNAAKQLWPEHAEAIEEAKTTSHLAGGDSIGHSSSGVGAMESGSKGWASSRTSGRQASIRYERDVVIVRAAWFRHEPVPMTEREATRAGLVEQRPYSPDEALAEGLIAETEDYDEYTGEPLSRYWLLETDEETDPSADNWPAPRLVLIESGEPTGPDAENWPETRGIRQTMALLDIERVIEDGRCPYSDIPLPWNRNIPMLDNPYGIGDPHRAEDPQQVANRLLTILGNHIKTWQFPVEYLPQSLVERLDDHDIDIHYRAGRQLGLTEEEVEAMNRMQGLRGTFAEPPAISGEHIELLQMMLDLIDKLLGPASVVKGEPPSPDSSGRAIYQLRQAAMGPLAYSAKFTENMLAHAGEIMAHGMFIDGWLSEDEWLDVSDRYPPGALRAAREMLMTASRLTVNAEVSAGAGVTQEIEKAEARQDYKDGLVGHRDTLKRLNDPDPERTYERKIEEETGLAYRDVVGPQGIAQAPGTGTGTGGGDAQAAAQPGPEIQPQGMPTGNPDLAMSGSSPGRPV